MTVKTYVKTVMIAALVAVALGGFLLHTRIHPVSQGSANLIPMLSGILSVLVIPLLFVSRRTIVWGYVLNGFTAIIGTVVMAHFTVAHWPNPATLPALLLNTLLADIIILWGKFFIGKALFDLEFFGYDSAREKKGKTWRYPNLGWWLVHLIGIGAIYAIGNILWR